MSLEIMNTRLPKKNSYNQKDLMGLSKRCDWFIHLDQCINITNTSNPKNIFMSNLRGDFTFPFFVKNILPNLTQSFNLIIASEDYSFPSGTEDARAQFYKFNDENVQLILNNPIAKRIFVENLDTIHPKLTPIPLGILLYNSNAKLDYNPIDFSNRSINVYCCHRFKGRKSSQWDERKRVTEFCKNEWKTFVYYEDEGISNTRLMNRLRNCKFCLCVRGGGCDPSPKCWESLMSGCIPIIKHSPVDKAYSRFPIIFVDNWSSDCINQEKLKEWFEKLRKFYEDADERRKVVEMLTMDYWWHNVINT